MRVCDLCGSKEKKLVKSDVRLAMTKPPEGGMMEMLPKPLFAFDIKDICEPCVEKLKLHIREFLYQPEKGED